MEMARCVARKMKSKVFFTVGKERMEVARGKQKH
jgi:hypothetical protein